MIASDLMRPFLQSLKPLAVSLIRKAGLLEFSDRIRMRLAKRRSPADKERFQKLHPGVALPPEEILYDAIGVLQWESYWQSGQESARFLAGIIRSHLSGGTVLEWGCGPARIVRHMPDALGPAFNVIGSDYNRRTIAWCAENIRSTRFLENGLMPPLAVAAESLACVYAVSVFTHLSEAAHRAWIQHLLLVLQPGGLLIISTHGDAARDRLLRREANAYDRGDLVVRDRVLRLQNVPRVPACGNSTRAARPRANEAP